MSKKYEKAYILMQWTEQTTAAPCVLEAFRMYSFLHPIYILDEWGIIQMEFNPLGVKPHGC